MKLVQKLIAAIAILGVASALSGLVFAYLGYALKSQPLPTKPLASSPPGSATVASVPQPNSTAVPPAANSVTPSGAPANPNPTAVPPTANPAAPSGNSKVEANLREFFVQKAGVKVSSITCPQNIQPNATTVFECKVTADNLTFPIKVQPGGSAGDLRVEAKGLLVLSRLEEQIQATVKQRTGITVKPNCGSKLRLIKAGDNFECKVTSDQGQTQIVQVTVEDDQGRVRWKI